MSESFADLFEESLQDIAMTPAPPSLWVKLSTSTATGLQSTLV